MMRIRFCPFSPTSTEICFVTMEEERFDQLFEEKSAKNARLRPGDRVGAVIAGISGENVFLDVGGKSEGVLAAAERAQVDYLVTGDEALLKKATVPALLPRDFVQVVCTP